MKRTFPASLVVVVALAACGGGGSSGGAGSTLTPFTPTGSTQTPTIDSKPANAEVIAVANSVGSAIDTFSGFETSSTVPALVSRPAASVRGAVTSTSSGTCTNGVIAYVPDLAGDANSTETQVFYDGACTQLARDTVRLFQAGSQSGSETVTSTVKQYAQGLSQTPTSIRSDVTSYTNATFNANGYPSLVGGYLRSSTGFLYVGSSKTIASDYELVMGKQSNMTNAFCSDDAGYSLIQSDTNDGLQYSSYGWSSLVNGGTRTVNGDGSVTWSATHTGNTYSGQIGSMSIAASAANTVCPIATPEFAITAPTTLGSKTMPITATYMNGVLTDLTIANAAIGQNLTLNVVTNSKLSTGDPSYISGTMTGASGPVGTFGVDAFGDGTLNVTVLGAVNTYPIVAWHVMKNPATGSTSTSSASRAH